MPNIVYPTFRKAVKSKAYDWVADDFRALAIDTGVYALNQAHEFLSSVTAGARIQAAVALAGKALAISGSIVKATATSPLVFLTMADAKAMGAVLIYHHDALGDASSRLAVWIDSAQGLPLIANGNNVEVHWSTGPYGIFAWEQG